MRPIQMLWIMVVAALLVCGMAAGSGEPKIPDLSGYDAQTLRVLAHNLYQRVHQQERRITDLEAEVAALKQRNAGLAARVPDEPEKQAVAAAPELKMELGSVGRLREGRQVGADPTWAGYAVVNVVDVENMIVRWQIRSAVRGVIRSGDPFWVRGVATEGLVTDRSVKLEGRLYKVTGTQTYDTAAGGQRTVFVIEPVTEAVAEAVDEPAE